MQNILYDNIIYLLSLETLEPLRVHKMILINPLLPEEFSTQKLVDNKLL